MGPNSEGAALWKFLSSSTNGSKFYSSLQQVLFTCSVKSGHWHCPPILGSINCLSVVYSLTFCIGFHNRGKHPLSFFKSVIFVFTTVRLWSLPSFHSFSTQSSIGASGDKGVSETMGPQHPTQRIGVGCPKLWLVKVLGPPDWVFFLSLALWVKCRHFLCQAYRCCET